jgi:hypothetical protein
MLDLVLFHTTDLADAYQKGTKFGGICYNLVPTGYLSNGSWLLVFVVA